MVMIKQSFEILMACIFSGIGMIFSGYILDKWQGSNLFKENDELWIIITPLLGLKGNIEMTLASRLSTMVKLKLIKSQWRTALSNILIIQMQSLMVGFGAATFGFLINGLSTFSSEMFIFEKYIRLIYITLLTAMVSSLILGIIMILIVYYSWKMKIDPDNIATPLGAAMGDTFTLFILCSVSNYCQTEKAITSYHYYSIGLVLFIYFPILFSQINWTEFPVWIPIILAMIFSSMSGYILKAFVFRIKYLANFQPLVNGIGGSIGSIFCSSLSTKYHLQKGLNCEPKGMFRIFLMFSVTIHFILLCICILLGMIPISVIISIIFPYFITVIVQTSFLLFISKKLVRKLWEININPDNGAIPIITGIGDLVGTLLLSLLLVKY